MGQERTKKVLPSLLYMLYTKNTMTFFDSMSD